MEVLLIILVESSVTSGVFGYFTANTTTVSKTNSKKFITPNIGDCLIGFLQAFVLTILAFAESFYGVLSIVSFGMTYEEIAKTDYPFSAYFLIVMAGLLAGVFLAFVSASTRLLREAHQNIAHERVARPKELKKPEEFSKLVVSAKDVAAIIIEASKNDSKAAKEDGKVVIYDGSVPTRPKGGQ